MDSAIVLRWGWKMGQQRNHLRDAAKLLVAARDGMVADWTWADKALVELRAAIEEAEGTGT